MKLSGGNRSSSSKFKTTLLRMLKIKVNWLKKLKRLEKLEALSRIFLTPSVK